MDPYPSSLPPSSLRRRHRCRCRPPVTQNLRESMSRNEINGRSSSCKNVFDVKGEISTTNAQRSDPCYCRSRYSCCCCYCHSPYSRYISRPSYTFPS